MTVGVLALQGDVQEHVAVMERLGFDVLKVRRPAELESVDGLIIPGGESTVIDKLLRAFELSDPVKARIESGMPVLGSCAGMILLASDVIGAIDGQRTLGGIPMTVRRNAFGRQVDSSEATVTWLRDGSEMSATFIRAPWVENFAAEVEVLAVSNDDQQRVVAVKHGNAIATAFHPEITAPGVAPDDRVHLLFAELIES